MVRRLPDMRSYIEELDRLGELCRVDRPLARAAVALGLPPDSHGGALVAAIAAALDRDPIPPVPVPKAPFQQNIRLGGDIDLTALPAPIVRCRDGGRSLNTYGLTIVRTPDGGWTDWSIDGMLPRGRNQLTGTFGADQHLGMIHREWRELGDPMPLAIALGVEPALPLLAGGLPAPAGIDEAEIAGAYFGTGIEIVACRTVDLQVPASAEIVIEGLVDPAAPLLTVTAIAHRDNAIATTVAALPPCEGDHLGWGIPHAAQTLHDLTGAGFPVTGVWVPPESGAHWMAVGLDTRWRSGPRWRGTPARRMCEHIGRAVFATKSGMDLPKLLVVEDDIDITDLRELVWAFATRCHPAHGNLHVGDERRAAARIVHNCLRPDSAWGSDGFADRWPSHRVVQDHPRSADRP
ncbi:UbiD family decarboxylase [Nocardia terpenica]|nr:UbiD family decarboxylase [Nocardia terpenica]